MTTMDFNLNNELAVVNEIFTHRHTESFIESLDAENNQEDFF